MRLYKKISNRSLSLVFIRSWYLSDRFGLSDCTDGEMFFEPLFIHEAGRGVGIYYDFTDPKKDPKLLLPFFEARMDRFRKLIMDYEIGCQEIMSLVKGKSKDVEAIYRLIRTTWPALAICDVVGAMTADEKYKELIDMAYEARVKNDQVVYRAEEYLSGIINNSPEVSDSELGDYVLPEEYIEGRVPAREELTQRKQGYIYFEGGLITNASVSDFCFEHGIDLVSSDLSGSNKSFRGATACKGKVVGPVVIVFEKSQMAKVRAGDILVMPMTTPDFLSVMKISAAFVTDEGGITCHAAIVARELGKPCIIGTRVATQVLKDGDIVEVDADHGVVRILE